MLRSCKEVAIPLDRMQSWHKKHEGDDKHTVDFACGEARVTCSEFDAILADCFELNVFVVPIQELPARKQYAWGADAVGAVLEAEPRQTTAVVSCRARLRSAASCIG